MLSKATKTTRHHLDLEAGVVVEGNPLGGEIGVGAGHIIITL